LSWSAGPVTGFFASSFVPGTDFGFETDAEHIFPRLSASFRVKSSFSAVSFPRRASRLGARSASNERDRETGLASLTSRPPRWAKLVFAGTYRARPLMLAREELFFAADEETETEPRAETETFAEPIFFAGVK
jgi:hypothetical protein